LSDNKRFCIDVRFNTATLLVGASEVFVCSARVLGGIGAAARR